MLASVRNIPFLIWNGAEDELVPVAGATAQAQTFDDLGYRYIFDLFTTADHFALAVNDQYAPAADFLGTHGSPQSGPCDATSSTRPWTSPAPGRSPTMPTGSPGCELRERAAATRRSARWTRARRGSARATRPPDPTQTGAGALAGGNLGAMPYVERSKTLGRRPARSRRDPLHLDAQNLSRVVVHPSARAPRAARRSST